MVNLSSVCAAVDERDNWSAPTVQRRAIVTRWPPRAKGRLEKPFLRNARHFSVTPAVPGDHRPAPLHPYRNDGASVVRSAAPRLR